MGLTPTTASAEVVAFAPGRVNLIGEHTDYNGGLALPFAIAAGVTVRARPGREAGTCRVRALDLGEEDAFSCAAPEPRAGWAAFARGAVAELAAAGVPVPGVELEITGNLPRGAGLSSSAALEVALCLALVRVAGAPALDRMVLARLCSRIENDWVGARSGLLDQIASLYGEPGRALLIDFADLAAVSVAPVPLELGAFRLVAVSSEEEHRLGESGYNDRRRECEEACARLGVANLSQARAEALDALPAVLARRARHILGEDERVRQAVSALERGDMARLGELLDGSHASLRDLYEVSTPAVEATVERLRAHGAVGARLVGGGFGGSVIALLAPGCALPENAMVLDAAAGARLEPAR